MTWRVGRHYPIHVYDGDTPVATFFREEDARRAVDAVTMTISPDLNPVLFEAIARCCDDNIATLKQEKRAAEAELEQIVRLRAVRAAAQEVLSIGIFNPTGSARVEAATAALAAAVEASN